MKIVFIVWRPYCRRGEVLAKKFSAEFYRIHYFRYRTPIIAPIKYILQAIKTLFILLSAKPDVVFSINPPIFCVLAAYIYCKSLGKRYVIDSDTGAFYRPWTSRTLLPLQKFLCRNAITTVVTNNHLAAVIRSWRGNSFVLEDCIPEFSGVMNTNRENGFHMTLINTFSSDEPTSNFIEAAKMFPAITFYITGDLSHAGETLLKNRTDNIIFTNFLPEDKYISLLANSDIIAVLCTENYTLNCGAYEAIALDKPLILSDWQILKDYFKTGTVFVDNSTQGIVEGISRAIAQKDQLLSQIVELKSTLNKEWEVKFSRLRNLLA